MSSTRRSTTGEFHQERYCSSPEFEGDAISGLPAAKRIALIEDKTVREILWFIQWRSLTPGGLKKLCDELLAAFPDRIGTPTLRKLEQSKRKSIPRQQFRQLRNEFDLPNDGDDVWSASLLLDGEPDNYKVPPEQYRIDYYLNEVRDSFDDLPQRLRDFCLNPKLDITKGVKYFEDLVNALVALRVRAGVQARSRLAETEITKKIFDTLDFWGSRRRMILIEGVAGIGRTESVKAWADSQGGLVRYVEVPSSSDDRSFFSAIARSLGVARGTSMKAQEIKVRIEEMLATSEVMLAFDEAQYLWGQSYRPRKTPDRLLWVKTVFDAGTPIALVAHTDFSKWQALFVKQTLWTDEQFERRLNRRIALPPEHSSDDMLKIARAHFQDGDRKCWNLLAAYALGTEKKQASGIVEALESARYRAEQDGRTRVEFTDIEAALVHDHGFLLKATAIPLQGRRTDAAEGQLSHRRNHVDQKGGVKTPISVGRNPEIDFVNR
jgi:hypothetical protein